MNSVSRPTSTRPSRRTSRTTARSGSSRSGRRSCRAARRSGSCSGTCDDRPVPDSQTIWLFCLAATALIVIPGPAVLYIVAQSVGQGRRAGLVSASGVASGGLGHVVFPAGGLSGLLLSSAPPFSAGKFAGAGYLIYLGGRRLLGLEPSALVQATEARPKRLLYRDGAVVNILNPKTALFFYAFLPQFLDPSKGSVAVQALVLGVIFVAIALASDSLWA